MSDILPKKRFMKTRGFYGFIAFQITFVCIVLAIRSLLPSLNFLWNDIEPGDADWVFSYHLSVPDITLTTNVFSAIIIFITFFIGMPFVHFSKHKKSSQLYYINSAIVISVAIVALAEVWFKFMAWKHGYLLVDYFSDAPSFYGEIRLVFFTALPIAGPVSTFVYWKIARPDYDFVQPATVALT